MAPKGPGPASLVTKPGPENLPCSADPRGVPSQDLGDRPPVLAHCLFYRITNKFLHVQSGDDRAELLVFVDPGCLEPQLAAHGRA